MDQWEEYQRDYQNNLDQSRKYAAAHQRRENYRQQDYQDNLDNLNRQNEFDAHQELRNAHNTLPGQEDDIDPSDDFKIWVEDRFNRIIDFVETEGKSEQDDKAWMMLKQCMAKSETSIQLMLDLEEKNVYTMAVYTNREEMSTSIGRVIKNMELNEGYDMSQIVQSNAVANALALNFVTGHLINTVMAFLVHQPGSNKVMKQRKTVINENGKKEDADAMTSLVSQYIDGTIGAAYGCKTVLKEFKNIREGMVDTY